MKASLRDKAVDIVHECFDMTIATLREDGFPHATTVSFAPDGLTLYFVCGAQSQKARNIACDARVSIAMTAPYGRWSDIRGVSLAGRAEFVASEAEIAEIGQRLMKRFPEAAEMEPPAPLEELSFIKVTPTIMSILDYKLGFGHTDEAVVGEDDVAKSHESTRHHWRVAAPATG